jgi:Abnormal spindle-like microcephaly-assoc'd, ASPM-SPD-2-Hydin
VPLGTWFKVAKKAHWKNIKDVSIHPEASFSPYRVDFETVAVGHEVTADVTVTSTGTTALDTSKVAVTDAAAGNFKPTRHCPSSLAPSDSCTIAVTFTPSATGSRTATLTVTDNVSEGSPHDVPISGTGSK